MGWAGRYAFKRTPLTGTARCTPLSKSTDERAHVRRTACASEEAVSARRDNHDDAGLDVEHGRSRPNTGNALHRAGIARVSGQSIECCFAGPRRTRCAAAEAEKKHQRQGDARTAEGTARPAQRDSCKAWAVAGEPSTAHYRERTLWGFFGSVIWDARTLETPGVRRLTLRAALRRHCKTGRTGQPAFS